MKQILEYALFANVILCIIYAAAYAVFLSRLKNHYIQRWNELGKPGIIRNNNAFTTWAAIRFIFNGKISDFLPFDKKLIYLLRTAFIALCIILVLFLIGLVIGNIGVENAG